MKVGDLVQVSVEALMSGNPQSSVEETGIVVEVISHEEVLILWDDGMLERNPSRDLAILKEVIEHEIEIMAMALADS